MSIRRMFVVLAALTVISLVGSAVGLGGLLQTGSSPTPEGEQVAALATPDPLATGTPSPRTGTPVARATPGPRETAAPLQATGDLVTDRRAFILLNPATVRPGSSVGVTGSGFDPGAQVNFTLKRKQDDRGQAVGFSQADKGGNVGGFSFGVPDTFVSGSFILVAKQQDGKRETSATGHLAANSPVVTFGTQVGKPGDQIAFSMKGFAPREEVKVYWNSLGSRPVASIQVDEGGGLLSGGLAVPFGAVGNNSFIFMGEKSQSPVTVAFLMLNLYPNVAVSSYAAKADTTLTFTGTGFGPQERVRVYLNSVQSSPIGIVEADETGAFAGAGGFVVPFDLKGKSTFIFIGEQSQAPATVSFDVLPYTPYAEASTYGGRPGTTVTFYGQGFARQEIVHIFVGRGQGASGQEVACALTDGQGALYSGGSYTIPGDARAGKLNFALVGSKSKAEATATMEVMDAGGPIQPAAPAPQPFQCPYTSADTQPAAPAPAAAPPTGRAAPAAQASPTPQPTATPPRTPTSQPRSQPTASATPQPATPPAQLTGQPAASATAQPTATPSRTPTPQTTATPARSPTPSPAASPTGTGTVAPSPTRAAGQ